MTPSLPQQEILQQIETFVFPSDACLRTNFCPRKTMWEEAQLLKLTGKWHGGEETDWLSNLDLIKQALDMIVSCGITGARLVIFPFEVTKDGKTYDWTAIDKMLNLMAERGLIVSLSLGPLDYPFGPDGIRLPLYLQQMIGQKKRHYSLSLKSSDPLITAIRDFSLEYLSQLLNRYGADQRIDKFYFGNEWPDTHSIEGTKSTMSISVDYMEIVVKKVILQTEKKIAFNTNIPPSNVSQLKRKFGSIFSHLKNRSVLGLDPYPTEEAKHWILSRKMKNYGKYVRQLAEVFPETEVIFTEYQAEVWPPAKLAGMSWAEMYEKYPDLVYDFFEQIFPRYFQSYMLDSGVKQIGLYGSPQWPILAKLGYEFPIQLLQKLSNQMKKGE